MRRFLLPFAILPFISSCVAPQAPAPAPPPPAPVIAPQPPAPVADRYAGDWSVDDLTPGDWQYSGGGQPAARFVQRNQPLLSLRCTGGVIAIERGGPLPSGASGLTLRTSYGERSLRAADGTARWLVPANDLLWDQIAYSRGRFLVEVSMMAPLILPTRAEVSRLIEDCRGPARS